MAWIFLLLAGLLEVGWMIGMKYSEGFTKLVPSALTVIALGASMWFLTIAVRTLPLGTSYAVWTGIGAVGGMIAGIMLFGESATAMRLASAALIVSGIVGLKLAA
jgi:quaternary ammonium compound-resistance protein SugE